jgi:hypothetical protein
LTRRQRSAVRSGLSSRISYTAARAVTEHVTDVISLGGIVAAAVHCHPDERAPGRSYPAALDSKLIDRQSQNVVVAARATAESVPPDNFSDRRWLCDP